MQQRGHACVVVEREILEVDFMQPHARQTYFKVCTSLHRSPHDDISWYGPLCDLEHPSRTISGLIDVAFSLNVCICIRC